MSARCILDGDSSVDSSISRGFKNIGRIIFFGCLQHRLKEAPLLIRLSCHHAFPTIPEALPPFTQSGGVPKTWLMGKKALLHSVHTKTSRFARPLGLVFPQVGLLPLLMEKRQWFMTALSTSVTGTLGTDFWTALSVLVRRQSERCGSSAQLCRGLSTL